MNVDAPQTLPEKVSAAPRDGRVRAVIEAVRPEVDCGRFPIKRVIGERVVVEADAFADGHDVLVCVLRYRHEADSEWREAAMKPLGNDRWRGSFPVERLGRYRYTVTAWVDPFLSWRHEFARRSEAEDILVAAQVGARLILEAAERAPTTEAQALREWAGRLAQGREAGEARRIGLDEGLAELAMRHPDRRLAAHAGRELEVVVDRVRARFSTWYELFPRSASPEPGRHGTFRDVEARLAYIASMGFDVLYLPPIHPIGRVRRKGKNNTLEASPDDVGSPWAIGAVEGGHKAVHPQLGTLADFRRLVEKAREHGLEIALDIAFQCAPDHPYVKEHPEWFRWRPDGTVQYAENPPKKYQDIYPFHFEGEAWASLWAELKSVFEFWIEQGVRIFRVDNPHTKPFPFWEWVIGELKRKHPELIFLSEAFTRPKVMHRLAKLGFTQSYTYFAWRNTKQELTAYFTELTQGEGREYFRPNVWPNTPDILTEFLQFGGRPAFTCRLLLAATLAASYGIYGPAFELQEREPREPGSEEYKDSEKYQLRHWDLDRSDSLRDLIARVNAIRRENPALQADWSLRFLPVDNDQLIAYMKSSEDGSNVMVMVVNLDPYHAQAGWVELDLEALGLDPRSSYQMHELLSGARYLWTGARNFVQLAPGMGHVFRLRRRVRTERDFDYFM
ncbi:alpha-1,4-glucan--maltose-1-phosphate maltosyltransferase [Pelomicrobium sp.]|jgi:starch synthase (maltosyl-transferring)|uniref:alpha-1,4-glucan--maltose-1-phosphate maltosyltransferase n=1 Tax=Pelomicrobium sp. TaxID=2815319 RepID=UPI002FDCBCDC